MIISNVSIQIQRPKAEVYNYLTTPDYYVLWQSGLLKVSASDGMNVGSIITFSSIRLGKKFDLTAEVVANDGRSTFRVTNTQGKIQFDALYQLQDQDGGTIVKVTNKIEATSVFRLAESVLQTITNNKYESDLKTLKALMEIEPVS